MEPKYTEADLPVKLLDGELITFSDGSTVRFEGNAEAKDVFFTDEFSPSVQLYPTMEHLFEVTGQTFKLTALFEDALLVERV